MKALRSALSLVALLVALPASAAPKHIIISDSLLANADKWNVKRGAQWMGRISKWRFGDYAVVASKSKGTFGGTRENFFKTKIEHYARRTFSFVLSNKTTDSAFVNAAHDVMDRSNPGLKVGDDVSIGGDDRVLESDRFTAFITLNRDTSEPWTLFIGSTDVSNTAGDYPEGSGTHAASLTLGERHIVLAPVFAKKLAEHQSFASQIALQFAPPAMGYEFVEDGQSLCAVEYFAGGISGSYKNTIWIHRNAEARLQLVLAAAMTAVLELECTALEGDAGTAQP